MGRVLFLAVFVALLCVFASNNSEGNGKFSQRFSDNGDSWDVINIDEYTAEKVLSYCTKELRDNTEAIEEFNLYLPQSTLNRYNVIANLPPKKKEAILNCLRDQALASQISRIDEETFLNKYQNLLSSWASVPRRLLRRKRRHHRIRRTTPSPGPSPGPVLFLASVVVVPIHEVHAPSPSPVIEPAPYPSPQVPTEAPEPSSPEDSPMTPLMPDGDPPSMPDGDSPSILPQAIPPFPPENNSIHSKYVVAVIAAGVVAGIGFVALFLSCCLNRNRSKIGPKESQRDEKPLLNCCSDVSGGSSNKTQCTSSVCLKNPKAPSSNTINQDSAEAESHKSETLGEPSDQSTSNLPLPPGRIAAAPPPPPGPPPAPPKPPAPAPPPPPRVSRPPNPPRRSPLGPHPGGHSSTNQGSDDSEAPKAKLKPFFWDKVLASSNQSMVWHEIKAGSFQFNEEMMENLFGYAQPAKNKNERNKDSPSFETPQLIQIINPKKSQNLAILLKALNVTTEEVCDALEEGNELPAELIQTLLKMAPTSEEELKLRLYTGDVSHLGPAERFLKILVEIPFAFKRLESLLFISIYQEEVSTIKEAHSTLEVACKELKNSRLFLKLLEAVLKTGNRMNDGTYRGGAQAFKLETLLKLSDVKGTDGKTTLLHFVVQEIIRSEGLRAARRLRQSQSISSSVRTDDLIEDSSNETEEYHRNLGLQVVARLSNELENVRKAALIDNETLTTSLSKIATSLKNTKEFLEKEMKDVEGESEFRDALVGFVEHAEADVASLLEEEKRIIGLVKSTVDYFHGCAGKDDGSRLFVIIRNFLMMLDKVCRELKSSSNKLPMKPLKKEVLTASPSQESRHESSSSPDYRQRLFPAIRERHVDEDFSSDDER